MGDDEIDYTLYEPAHPKGSAYYDSAIKAIPITEASPDETQVLRYKIVTLPKGTTTIPTIKTGLLGGISATQLDGVVGLTPTTTPSGNMNAGYTVILADQRAGTLSVSKGATNTSAAAFLGDEITTTAQVVSGQEFKFTPNPSLTTDITTTITIYGNETGGSETIPVYITYKQTV